MAVFLYLFPLQSSRTTPVTGVNKSIFLQFLFPARNLTYTKKNILSAWEATGIYPLNPRKVLQSQKRENAKNAKSATSHPSIAITATPRTSRCAASVARQATGLIKNDTASAQKLKVLINQLSKGLQSVIIDKEIGEHMHHKYRQRVENKPDIKSNDRRRLTKARVITTEEVIRLREEREEADRKKSEKKGKGRGRPKKSDSGGTSGPSTPAKRKKTVHIAKKVTVHLDSEEEFEEWEIGGSEPEEMGDFEEERDSDGDYTPSKPQGKAVWDDEKHEHMIENVNKSIEGHGRVLRSRN